MRVTMLGCGGSGGVPTAAGKWGRCDPANPKNRRRRPSILVARGGANILVDASPDLREQLLDAAIERIDAVLFTHTHADHVHGIDDLRPFQLRAGRPLDAWAEPGVMAELHRRFDYLFDERAADAIYRPIFASHLIDGPFAIAGHDIVPFPQDHGTCPTTGFRFGPFAYSTDVVALPEAAFAALEGVRVWIVDCLRPGRPHPTHAHLARTLDWIARVKPDRAVLTHMNHQADYEALRALLPDGVEPGYDGLVLEVAE